MPNALPRYDHHENRFFRAFRRECDDKQIAKMVRGMHPTIGGKDEYIRIMDSWANHMAFDVTK